MLHKRVLAPMEPQIQKGKVSLIYWMITEHVIPDWAEATTMSMLGPLTCSALTVIDPLVPLGELVCSLTMRLMPPGNEMARLGLDTRMDWPAATKPTNSAFPLTEA